MAKVFQLFLFEKTFVQVFMTQGKVYLVGAGPGDLGLITVKGQQILKQADVVLYDHLSPQRIAATDQTPVQN